MALVVLPALEFWHTLKSSGSFRSFRPLNSLYTLRASGPFRSFRSLNPLDTLRPSRSRWSGIPIPVPEPVGLWSVVLEFLVRLEVLEVLLVLPAPEFLLHLEVLEALEALEALLVPESVHLEVLEVLLVLPAPEFLAHLGTLSASRSGKSSRSSGSSRPVMLLNSELFKIPCKIKLNVCCNKGSDIFEQLISEDKLWNRNWNNAEI